MDVFLQWDGRLARRFAAGEMDSALQADDGRDARPTEEENLITEKTPCISPAKIARYGYCLLQHVVALD
jgi:hypothetical protein